MKKKGAAQTATDVVLKIIKRSKEGVDVSSLIKKTGFEDKKIRNILFRMSKQGDIKKAEARIPSPCIYSKVLDHDRIALRTIPRPSHG